MKKLNRFIKNLDGTWTLSKYHTPGAKFTFTDGTIYQCNEHGSWIRKQDSHRRAKIKAKRHEATTN